jgi:LysM domain
VSPGRSLVGAVLALLVMAGLVVASQVSVDDGQEPLEVIVVPGDTLGRIAAKHRVEVEQLLRWNNLESDRIEVGQRLLVYVDAASVDAPPAVRSRRTGGGGGGPTEVSATTDLRLPAAKPCLEGPTDGPEGGDEPTMAASAGLDGSQVQGAMRAFMPNLQRCWPAGASLSGEIQTEITVACNGRVARVDVLDAGGLPTDVVGCVADTLRYVPFPSHDQPDGYTFAHPFRFTP